ncbi:hypothetical protein MASR2M78_12790 [Treponema sp.]
MPDKQLGIFLNSPTGFWAICATLLVLLFAGRLIMKKFIGREYIGQALVILAIAYMSAIFFALTLWFPVRGEVSAAVIPRLWIVAIFACLAYLFAKIIRKTETPDEEAGDISLPIKFILAIFVYIVLMVLIGYFLSSIVFIAATMTLLSYKRRLVILAISGGWMIFSYLVFYRMLYVPLPQGILINALFG